MANVRWIGGATATAQVDTLTVGGTIEADDVFIITVTAESGDTYALSVTGGSTDADTCATAIATAWNASTHPYLTPITAAAVGGASGQLTLTADTAGQPFSVAASTTEAGGGAADLQTFTRAATTASSGPYDFNITSNWDNEGVAGDLPGNNADDIVFIQDGTILYGLDQSGAAQPYDNLHISNAQIGQNPTTGLPPAYLKVAVSNAIEIGEHFGPGTVTHATPVLIDSLTQATQIRVWASGTNSTSSLPAVWLKCNSATTDITVSGGTVGLAYGKGDTATLGDIVMIGGSLVTNPQNNAGITTSGNLIIRGGSIVFGNTGGSPTIYQSGGTLQTIETGVLPEMAMDGGTCLTRATITLLNMNGGTFTIENSVAGVARSITTLNQRGGTVIHNATGTSGGGSGLNVYAGTLDYSQSNAERTITVLKLGPGATFKYNALEVTLSADIQLTSDTGVRTVSVA